MDIYTYTVIVIAFSMFLGYVSGFKRGKKEGSFQNGYEQGKRDGVKEIFKALGVRDGYEIESVSFRKSRK